MDTIEFLYMKIFQTKQRIDKVLDDADILTTRMAEMKNMEKEIPAASVEHVMWERDLLKAKNKFNIDMRILDNLIAIRSGYEDLVVREKALRDWAEKVAEKEKKEG